MKRKTAQKIKKRQAANRRAANRQKAEQRALRQNPAQAPMREEDVSGAVGRGPNEARPGNVVPRLAAEQRAAAVQPQIEPPAEAPALPETPPEAAAPARRRKLLPLLRLPLPVSLLLTLPLAAGETALALAIQPGDFGVLWAFLKTQPTLLFLNFLPFWLLTVAAVFLLSDPWRGAALAGGIGGVLALVNRTMIEKRDEPFSPKDLALIKEAGDAMGSYGLSVHLPSLLAILGLILGLILLSFLFRGKRPFKKRWGNVCIALAGAAVALGVLTGCVRQVYSSKELYNSFPVENRFYITGVYNQLGFPYCFCYNFSTYLVEKPEGFDAGEVRGYTAGYPEEAGGDPVSVVCVMNEAFSDLTNQPQFDYPAGEEPLAFFNSLADSDRAVSGHIVVPNYGGGTANTEFDVITGMQTNLIGESGASAFRVLNHDVDSLFRVFREDGYQTEFIHPGQAWFYNRQNVYRYFGAETLLFSEEFEDAERKGTWVTDKAVGEKMIQEYEAAMEAGKPWFNYTTTIQNHMAYGWAKYGHEYVLPPVPLAEGVEVEPGVGTMLACYAEGIRDADALLRALTEYFDGREEPVVLVYFGDHLPNLGDDYLCYRQLGVAVGEGIDVETTLFTYETPYVIWANQTAAEQLDFPARLAALGLPEDHTVNANFLGAAVLELTGRRHADSFFAYLNELRRDLPVFHNGTGREADGAAFEELPAAYAGDLRKLRWWEYYKLKVE